MVVAAVALVATGGCGEARPASSPVGDDGWGPSLRGQTFAAAEPTLPTAPRARPIPADQRARWAHADSIAHLVDLEVRGPSEHDDARYERTLRISAAQAEAYRHLTLGTVMPTGTVIVQRHHEPSSEEVTGRYAMVKVEGEPDAWTFVVLDQAMRVAADEQLTLCGRCHGDAPFHGLFGIPTLD